VGRVLLVVAAGAAALLTASLAAGAAETVTIQVRPSVAPWAGELAFDGVVSSGQPREEVVVEERACNSNTFRYLLTTETLAGGRWDLHWNALEHSSYRARWRGAVSRVVSVQKRPGVTLRNPTRHRYVVDVFAVRSFRGRTATLQRFARQSRRWVTVRRFTITTGGTTQGATVASSATVRARLPRNTLLRVATPATDCYLVGFSNMLQSR
jgi:hypothetical protein